MTYRGRPVLGAISGFFLGLFVATDLLLLTTIQLDSPLLTILPIVGLVLGLVLGLWAPLGRARVAPATPTMAAPAATAATAPPPASPEPTPGVSDAPGEPPV
jgi:hypothetical protein